MESITQTIEKYRNRKQKKREIMKVHTCVCSIYIEAKYRSFSLVSDYLTLMSISNMAWLLYCAWCEDERCLKLHTVIFTSAKHELSLLHMPYVQCY